MAPLHKFIAGLILIAEVAVLMRAILRPNREPASRLAWVIVIVVVPVIGFFAYLLFGEARISNSRRERGRAIDARLPRPAGDEASARILAKGAYASPFAFARSINGLDPTGGNRALLAADSNAAIDAMVEDMDAATSSIHLSAYIWLADHNGGKVKDACIRAVERGVTVRALADALGGGVTSSALAIGAP